MSCYRDDTVKIIAIISAVVVAVALIHLFVCRSKDIWTLNHITETGLLIFLNIDRFMNPAL